MEICPMPQLMEVEFGKWEGMTWAEIKEAYPKAYQCWSLSPAEVTPPGGESRAEIIDRCTWTIKEILKRTNGQEDAAVVSHGATIAHLISCMMGADQEESGIIVENASITTVNYNPATEDFMLLQINDTSHLAD